MSDDADERERSEAEALSRALEASGRDGDTGADSAADDVRDALETAALLRYGRGESELRAERADAVLERLLPRVDAVRTPRAPRRVTRLVPIGAAALAAAAGAWLVISSALAPSEVTEAVHPASAGAAGAPVAPAGGNVGALPAPSPELLAAQAALAGDDAARDRAAFEAAMRAYREQVLHAFERAYPARLGMLEARGAR